MVRPLVYDEYEVQWQEVRAWASTIEASLPVTWPSIINDAEDRCGDRACSLGSATELDIMMLYCSKDMSACSLPAYNSTFPEGRRPSGPFTLLVQEGVIPESDVGKYTMHDFFSPQLLLSYL